YSLGGGAVCYDNISADERNIYDLTTMSDILSMLEKTGKSFWEYVEICEGEDIRDFLKDVWHTMNDSIDRGLAAEGALPGGLGLARKAHSFYRKASIHEGYMKQNGIVSAYALAVAEENASGHVIVTAPTCGASGCLPAVIRHTSETIGCSEYEILKSLATSALFGNLIKTNASISGAEVGCQGEIGTSCSMAAAAATQLMGGTVRQIEYAAEMGLEHNLGLTCDPVKGLVQIPCIERNAHAAVRSLSCSHYSLLSDGSHRISFDDVVAVMRETGNALPSMYRETSKGGLARIYRDE
ncbi:L-serine ammonia-lyase, iron-sulfur-dependent, subunit alpha, partial [bacterium]|nr:L-serine ammonia-lyase, iron-sulfur-dependent, subunit alpha [bacterium]